MFCCQLIKILILLCLFGKTSYYQNTNDMKTDEVAEDVETELGSLLNELSTIEEGECESCAI